MSMYYSGLLDKLDEIFGVCRTRGVGMRERGFVSGFVHGGGAGETCGVVHESGRCWVKVRARST